MYLSNYSSYSSDFYMIIIISVKTLLVISNRKIYSNGRKQKLNFGSNN